MPVLFEFNFDNRRNSTEFLQGTVEMCKPPASKGDPQVQTRQATCPGVSYPVIVCSSCQLSGDSAGSRQSRMIPDVFFKPSL
jgi:hypothetical protein